MYIENFLNKSNFSSLSTQKIRRNDRDPRHFAPANKEWKNSVYAYNKNTILNSSVKDKLAGSLIKSYFDLVPTPTNITKSKRMRDWLRRSSTKQLFVSKPEIKQNNDKAIITVYTHDREKNLYMKKLFGLHKWLNTHVLGLSSLYKDKIRSEKYLTSKYNIKQLTENKILGRGRYATRKLISRYRIKPEIFKNTSLSLLRKKQFLSNMYFFQFLKWTLSLFRIEISIVPDVISINRPVLKNRRKINRMKRINVVYLILTKIDKNSKNIVSKKKILIKNAFNIYSFKLINIILLQYLMVNISKILDIKQENKVFSLFKVFKAKYYNAIMRRYLKKEILVIKYLTKLNINRFKYYNYLPGLKSFLNKIYDKKVQLNIVSLKYLHLSSDLFSEAISIKLRDRTTSLLAVLGRSFRLVKTYKPNNMFILAEKEKNYIAKDINTYFGKYNVIKGNIINSVFRKMFENKSEKKGLTSNIKSVLVSLKYKWVTGVRVEAKGRLTKRYAAARALFKYKYKGTLKNLEHLRNIENKIQSPSVFIMRGEARPNTQYSFVPSKRRIGAFGIKSWISNS